MSIKITATHFYNYIQCPHRVFLNIFEDPLKKEPISDFIRSKIEQGIMHEKDVMKDIKSVEVKYTNDEDGYKKTIELMKEGVDIIYQGVLVYNDLVGRPDLLIKKEGKSKFGDYYYKAVEIKSGKNLKKEYRIQIIFYNYILGKIQGYLPKKGGLINHDKTENYFNVEEELEEFKDILKRLRISFNNKQDFDFNISSSCSECQWKDYCFQDAVNKKDMSLIYGMNKNAKLGLISQGIKDIETFSKNDLEDIEIIKGVSIKRMNRWLLQAKSLVNNSEIILKKPKFNDVKYEIFFDIEGDPLLGIDYLYGLLVYGDKEKFYSFFSDGPDDEESVWKQFVDLIDSLDDSFSIYYYTNYEKNSIKKMIKKYGISKDLEKKLMNSLVDLFPIVKKSVILPLYSYTIKDIAKYLGFKWNNKNAGGTQSMFWYSKYLDGEDGFKDLIIEYNKDDCYATKVLKDWLCDL